MFTRIYADNYRCFSNFSLELSELSTLLGSNGAGKSTVLSLLVNLRDFVMGNGKSLDLFPPETLTRWDLRTEQTFECTMKLSDGEYRYRLRLSHRPEQGLNKVEEESLHLDGNPLFKATVTEMLLYNDNHQQGPRLQPDWHVSGLSRIYPRGDNRKLTAFKTAFESTLIIAMNPGSVTAVSSGRVPVKLPQMNCSDFAGWLRYITSARALASREAERNLAAGGLPGFRAFQVEPSGDAEIIQCLFDKSPRSVMKLRLDELSSGQIAMIILECVIAFANDDESRGGVTLFLDEPGNYLALAEIQPLLTRLRDGAIEGRFQTILTAHHPIAVDFLAGTHGLWFERETSGPTRVHRIQMTDDDSSHSEGMRVSDLIARGWLSSLGVVSNESTIQAANDSRE